MDPVLLGVLIGSSVNGGPMTNLVGAFARAIADVLAPPSPPAPAQVQVPVYQVPAPVCAPGPYYQVHSGMQVVPTQGASDPQTSLLDRLDRIESLLLAQAPVAASSPGPQQQAAQQQAAAAQPQAQISNADVLAVDVSALSKGQRALLERFIAAKGLKKV